MSHRLTPQEQTTTRTAADCLRDGHNVRAWWDVPYGHSMDLDDDYGRVVIHTDSYRIGETTGDNEYLCDVCGSVAEPTEVEYV